MEGRCADPLPRVAAPAARHPVGGNGMRGDKHDVGNPAATVADLAGVGGESERVGGSYAGIRVAAPGTGEPAGIREPGGMGSGERIDASAPDGDSGATGSVAGATANPGDGGSGGTTDGGSGGTANPGERASTGSRDADDRAGAGSGPGTRRRGRPKRTETATETGGPGTADETGAAQAARPETVRVTSDGVGDPIAPGGAKPLTRGSNATRAAKRKPAKKGAVTGEQVTVMANLGFNLCAISRGPHWRAKPGEIEAWADEAAELLALIPANVASSVINMSAAVTVAVGLGNMVKTRVDIDRKLRPQKPQPPKPTAPASAGRIVQFPGAPVTDARASTAQPGAPNQFPEPGAFDLPFGVTGDLGG